MKAIRIDAGYSSQRKFARALAVSGAVVGQWEKGVKVPGRESLAKISALTGHTIGFILGNEEFPGEMPKSQLELEAELLRLFRAAPRAFQENLVELLRQAQEMRTEVNHQHQPAQLELIVAQFAMASLERVLHLSETANWQ